MDEYNYGFAKDDSFLECPSCEVKIKVSTILYDAKSDDLPF